MRKAFRIIIPLASCVFLSGCFQNGASDSASFVATKGVYKTSGDKIALLQEEDNLPIADYAAQEGHNVVSVDLADKKQPVRFFGGALTHASAHVLMSAPSAAVRTAILKDLFSSEGADFNAIRVPIGASDFISEPHFFTCCDSQGAGGDPLASFTLGHDQEIIEVIKQIYAIKPDLKIIAAPWSAPAWMKENGETSSADPSGYALCGGPLASAYISVYAQYLVRFVEGYKSAGITVDYLSLLNEPLVSGTAYPSMYMPPGTAVSVAAKLVGLLPDYVRLIAYDHNCEDAMYSYLSAEFATERISSSFEGIAIHGYGSEAIPTAVPKLLERYPSQEVYMTEICEWEHSSTFSQDLIYAAENTCTLPYNAGLSGTVYWNLILDSGGKPNLGQYSICYGLTNLDIASDGTASYTKNPAYYAMAMASKSLAISDDNPVYALRISSNDEDLAGSAFVTGGGTYELVLFNSGGDDISFDVAFAGKGFASALEAKSMITFIFKEE